LQDAEIGISSLEYDLVTRSDLKEAIDEIGIRHTVPPFGQSTVFDVLVDDERRLSPKAVVGLAAKHRLGRDVGPSTFSGGEASRSFHLLIERGFEIVTKPTQIQGFDATCSVGRRAETFFIILDSRGPGRNTDYAEGFESVLYTLADIDARELRAYIDSRETRMLSKAQRQLAPSSGSIGIAMRAVDNVSELRRSIAGAAAAFGRNGAPGGNNTKRVRLEFRLGKPMEIRRIAAAIGEDKGAADGPIRGVNFHPSSPTQSLELQQRKAVDSTDVTRVHAKMQKSLYEKLCQTYGKQNVAVELAMSSGRPADIVVRQPDGFLVFEIKTAVSPRACVRQALGQLLEYSYWPGSANCAGLKIVGQTSMDTRTQEYLEGLRTRFSLNVEYLHEPLEL
jgi:hypothetical protein